MCAVIYYVIRYMICYNDVQNNLLSDSLLES